MPSTVFRRLQQPRLALQALGLILGVFAATVVLEATGGYQRLEWIAFDARARLMRADAHAAEQVAVILVDEASLEALETDVGRWPWPRSVYADLLEFLNLGGARLVLFDILFTEGERAAADRAEEQDLRLAEATGAAGNVVHAARILKDREDEGGGTRLDRPLPEGVAERFALPGLNWDRPIRPSEQNNAYYLPFPSLLETSAQIGVVDFDPDADGVYRRTHLLRPYQDQGFPSLALVPLLDETSPVTMGTRGLTVGTLQIPLSGDGTYLINPYGHFRTYSVSGIFASLQRIWQGEVDDLLIDPYEFQDAVVFVGASAVGLQDLKATPLSATTPGVLTHAAAASNLLSGDILQPLPRAATLAIALCLAALTVATILFVPLPAVQVGGPVLLAGGYLGWNLYAFGGNLLAPLAAPLGAVGMAWLGSFAVHAATEGRHQRRVRRMLSQYVSPEVMAEVVDRYEEVLRAEVGEKKHLTVLFSDIRGFTSVSENYDAAQVVEILNTYFSEMTEAVFEQEGTIDKFIGDAMMCFWGAPILAPDHAVRAVRCAMAMRERLRQVNQVLRDKGYPGLRIGVGINTGEMVLGNIGSDRKLDYTVIGDQVNLASRLEGLTKVYGTGVILSEQTRQELPPEIPCGVVDQVRVKGKQRPLRIYRPLVPSNPDAKRLEVGRRLAEGYERAFQAYLRQDWHQARKLYSQLPLDAVVRQFLFRCEAYLVSGAPAEWDGVYNLETK